MKKSAKSGSGADNARGSGDKSPGGKSFGGLRHLFTARAARSGEAGGFQTVACSPKLGSLVEAVEGLVAGYSAPEAEAPGCRQLLPVPGRSNAYALTTFTPTGRTPDERPGNSWAETVVVPAAWLEQAGWDAAAAFAAIGWQGPQDLASLSDELPPVELPVLAAGPLSRLAALVRAVPEGLLYPLLLAGIQQSHGLLPVRLLEAPGAEPRLLEDVVTLLPLVVPPALRTYRDGEQRRCLTLRTRSPRGGMSPAADVTGFPAAAAAELEQEQGGVVIDLGGALPAPELRDRHGEAYARWLVRVLREGRWEELEERYAEEITGPAAGWFAGFGLDQTAARPPEPGAAGESGAAETGAAPSVFRAREAGWRAREDAEAEAWGVLKEQRRQFEETLAGLRQEMTGAVAQASERLKKYVKGQRQLAEGKAEEAAKEAARDGALEKRVEDLEADLRRLDIALRQLREKLPGQKPATVEAGTTLESLPEAKGETLTKEGADPSSAEGDQPEPPSRGKVLPALGESLRSFKDRWAAGKVGFWGLVRLIWQAGLGVVALLLLVLLIGKGAAWLLPQTPPGAAMVPSIGPPAVPTPGDESPATPAQRRQALLGRLQDGATAAALLRQAAGREGFERRAQALLLVRLLPTSAPLTEGAKIAFLQQALGIEVDAGWGRGSSDALEDKLPQPCRACRQSERGWEGEGFLTQNGSSASCFLNDHLRLEGPKCNGEPPWRQGRVWTEAEAEAALALFRATRETLQASGQPNRQALAGEIAKLDPAAPEGAQLWADLRSSRQLPADYAETLLGLAYSLVTDDPEAMAAPEDLDEDQLGEIEALLDAAVSPEKPANEGGGAG